MQGRAHDVDKTTAMHTFDACKDAVIMRKIKKEQSTVILVDGSVHGFIRPE
jgi:hypothetical protein